MSDMQPGRSARRMGPGRRRGPLLAGLAATLFVAVLPAFADTPETGSEPGVTLTVTPDDQLGTGQTVSVTGAGFPASAPGIIRQCGGPAAAPQCDPDVLATFVTTPTGQIPPTAVTVTRIIDTGTTTFNCGVQACFLVATAGGRSSQHHISILGAGTVVPTSTSTSSTSTTSPTSTSSTSTSTSVVPSTTVPTTPFLGAVCPILRSLLGPFPFLQSLVDALLALFGCPPAA